MEIQNKLEWYQEQTKRTLPNLGNDSINLAHMVLGMFSEYSELLDATALNDKVGIGEELADKFWYLSNYCNLRGYSLSDLVEDSKHNDPKKSYLFYLSEIQDLVKKKLAYNKDINKTVEYTLLVNYISRLIELVKYHDLDVEVILENNINKLKIRFPDKFTEENAKNRNTKAERVVLEKNK